MREAEKAALEEIAVAAKQISKGILAIIGGELPETSAGAVAPRVAKPAKTAPVSEEANIQWVEDQNGFGCLVCNEGVFKIAETGIHMWQEHQIPMSQISGDGLTHGRKWQMKVALEKAGLTEALEGYGRGAAAPAAKPARVKAVAEAETVAPKKKWGFGKPKASQPEETDSETVSPYLQKLSRPNGIMNDIIDHYVLIKDNSSPDGYTKGIINGDWTPESKNFLFEELTGRVRSVPKKAVWIISPYQRGEIDPELTIMVPPHGEEEAEAPKTAPKKPWQKKPPAAPVAPAGSLTEKDLAKRYGLDQKQVQFVKGYAQKKGMSLNDAAIALRLDEAAQEGEAEE